MLNMLKNMVEPDSSAIWIMLPRFCVWVSADVPWNLRRPLPSLYCFTGLNPATLFFFFKVFLCFLVILPRQKYAIARVFPQSNVLFGVGWDQCPIQNQVLKICGVAHGWWNLGRLGSKRWWAGQLNACEKNIICMMALWTLHSCWNRGCRPRREDPGCSQIMAAPKAIAGHATKTLLD